MSRQFYAVVNHREGPEVIAVYSNDVLIARVTYHTHPDYLILIDILGDATKYAYFGDMLTEYTISHCGEVFIWVPPCAGAAVARLVAGMHLVTGAVRAAGAACVRNVGAPIAGRAAGDPPAALPAGERRVYTRDHVPRVLQFGMQSDSSLRTDVRAHVRRRCTPDCCVVTWDS